MFGIPEVEVQVIIGGVQYVPQTVLEAAFQPYGLKSIKMVPGQESALAVFKAWGAAERAIQGLNGAKLSAMAGEGIKMKFADVMPDRAKRPGQTPKADAKVFIGNLNTLATEEAVTELCKGFGVVKQTKIVSKRDGQAPCGFVTFGTLEQAAQCVSLLNGFQHDLSAAGKSLNVQLADIDKREDRQDETPIEEQPQIFIGGLPTSCTDDFVYGMCAPFGPVTEAWVQKTKGQLGVGFARFQHIGSCQLAVATIGQLGRYNVKISEWGAQAAIAQKKLENARPGDWVCLSCNDLNFAQNDACRKCAVARPIHKDPAADWVCVLCNDVQFAKNLQCRKCGAPKPIVPGEEQAALSEDPPGYTPRAGDWLCPTCNDLQFAKNQACRKCHTKNPYLGPDGSIDPAFLQTMQSMMAPGDWICRKCGDVQFAKNQTCRKCSAAKPENEPSHAVALKREDMEGIPLPIQYFVLQWGLDAYSASMLVQLDQQTLSKVMVEFAPNQRTRDNNKLLRGFVRSVLGVQIPKPPS